MKIDWVMIVFIQQRAVMPLRNAVSRITAIILFTVIFLFSYHLTSDELRGLQAGINSSSPTELTYTLTSRRTNDSRNAACTNRLIAIDGSPKSILFDDREISACLHFFEAVLANAPLSYSAQLGRTAALGMQGDRTGFNAGLVRLKRMAPNQLAAAMSRLIIAQTQEDFIDPASHALLRDDMKALIDDPIALDLIASKALEDEQTMAFVESVLQQMSTEYQKSFVAKLHYLRSQP